jgi:hypothetical protein
MSNNDHVHGRPDNEAEELDNLLGRGPGDGDMHGYPGQEETSHPKVKVKTQTIIMSDDINLTSTISTIKNSTGVKEQQ